MAVLPSIMENSAYTVMECLTMGIPMVASDVGGTSELVHPDDVDKVLTIPTPKPLAKRIREILREGLRPGRPKVWTDVDKTWVVWHHMLMYKAKARGVYSSTLKP
jgi:glycosyltransferase involved in cell wall biosynthesis